MGKFSAKDKLILFFFLYLFTFTIQKTWTAEELASIVKNDTSKILISDMTIPPSDFDELLNLTKTFSSKYNSRVNSFLIEYMDYQKYGLDIEKFANDIAFLINDSTNDPNSLIIVISRKDRKVRIRTGKILKENLKDNVIGSITLDALNYFKKQNFVEGLKQILYNADYYYGASSMVTAGDVILYIFIAIVIIVVLIVIVFTCIANREKAQATERLNKLKNHMVNDNKPLNQFHETTCVICLDDFPENQLNNSIIVNSNSNDPKGLKYLQCGHRFHNECISSWIEKSDSCPTCRYSIHESSDKPTLSRNIVMVQTVYYPSLHNYTFDYSSNHFSWSAPVSVSTGSSGSSSYGGGFSSGSGGATGSW